MAFKLSRYDCSCGLYVSCCWARGVVKVAGLLGSGCSKNLKGLSDGSGFSDGTNPNAGLVFSLKLVWVDCGEGRFWGFTGFPLN